MEYPLFIMPIIPNQDNPNLTPMVFGINGHDVNVIYVPDNNHIPAVQNQPKQVITNYHHVYSFQNLLDSFNIALKKAYLDAGSPGGKGAPFFVFNPTSQLISLIVSVSFIDSNADITTNQYAINFLEGFRFSFLGNDKFRFILQNTGNNGFNIPGQTIPITTPPTFLSITQEYITVPYWFSLRKILLVSNNITIYHESVYCSNSQNNYYSLPILCDLFVPQNYDRKCMVFYNPKSQYRLIDLYGSSPINNINLSILWQDKLGNIYPVYIKVMQQANIKIGFFRKKTFNIG